MEEKTTKVGRLLRMHDSNSREASDLAAGAPSDLGGCEADEVASKHTHRTGTFHKWMKSLHRKAARRPAIHAEMREGDTGPTRSKRLRHVLAPGGTRQAESVSESSSANFISAVRSTTGSFTSASLVTRPRRNTAQSHRHSRTDRSSRASLRTPRISEDSVRPRQLPEYDMAAVERALQRHKILDELVTTEEGYIGDVRFLINVYITILATVPSLHHGLRASINENLAEIVNLHEELLAELRRVIPSHSESGLPNIASDSSTVATALSRSSRFQDGAALMSEPQVVAEVSRIFAKKLHRLFVYKEYGAKYELMIKDIAAAHESLPDWGLYQKGLEALASSIGPTGTKRVASRKSLTIGDLLVKPIQRICRYPLLFAELLRHTPVTDCPNSHMEIDSVLTRLREATTEINTATDDGQTKQTLEKTWLLQDRLVFPNCRLDATSKARVRSFGHIQLCGVLHVCWQSKTGIAGQYFICLLYHDLLCLAKAGRAEAMYTIQACISLKGSRLEDADCGRGLQCHTAPYSWKLTFECDNQLYEMILSACSSEEEQAWKSRLSHTCGEHGDGQDPAIFATLDLDIQSLGAVFGKPGTYARKISIQRALTVGSGPPVCQVILKNTDRARASGDVASDVPAITRSQSLLVTDTGIPILTPSRSERVRIEHLLFDVWSRDILPYPAMATMSARSRSEYLVRTSASTMMRKLSMAGITASLKRTGSLSQKPTERRDADDRRDAESLNRRISDRSQLRYLERKQRRQSEVTLNRALRNQNQSAESQGAATPDTVRRRQPVRSKTETAPESSADDKVAAVSWVTSISSLGLD